MNEVYIYDILRVPTGKLGGAYKDSLPEKLSSFLINEIIKRNELQGEGEVILANAIGGMGNMARSATLDSNLPNETSAFTIDSQCGGAYKAIEMAFAILKSEMKDWVVAGGMESNSLQPDRFYAKNDPRKKSDEPIKTAEFATFPTLSLAAAAEKMAIDYGVTSTEMINWTLDSHKKTFDTYKNELLKSNLCSFQNRLLKDQMLKPGLTIDILQKFAGEALINRSNTADFHDGAGIALMGNRNLADIIDIDPLARIVKINFVGVHPDLSPQGVIAATKETIKDFPIEDIELFEVCESYAVKPLSFAKEFNIDHKKINVLGGNLAMGHPFAASGIINLLNLQKGLQETGKRYGLVTAGIAGGMGVSMVIENLR